MGSALSDALEESTTPLISWAVASPVRIVGPSVATCVGPGVGTSLEGTGDVIGASVLHKR